MRSLPHLETSKEVGQMPTLSSVSSHQKFQKCREGVGDALGPVSEPPLGRPHPITCANCRKPHSEIIHANWGNMLSGIEETLKQKSPELQTSKYWS